MHLPQICGVESAAQRGLRRLFQRRNASVCGKGMRKQATLSPGGEMLAEVFGQLCRLPEFLQSASQFTPLNLQKGGQS